MVIREIRRPSRGQQAQMLAVLTDGFWRTPLFHRYLFPGQRKLAGLFLRALLRYGLRVGRCFVAEEEASGIVACALWSLPESPAFTLPTLLRLGAWPPMLAIAVRNPAAVRRIREFLRMLETFAPGFPCTTLEYLASVQKGAGKRLLRESMAVFGDATLHLESIVSREDHSFYRQFGFEPFARTQFHGTDYAFMLRMASDGGEAATPPAQGGKHCGRTVGAD